MQTAVPFCPTSHSVFKPQGDDGKQGPGFSMVVEAKLKQNRVLRKRKVTGRPLFHKKPVMLE